MKWNSNARDNLAIVAIFASLVGCGYFVKNLYPEVWQALGILLYFVIILSFVMFVIRAFFFNTGSEKETTPRMKIIKLILFSALVLLAMWWLSRPVPPL
jgi:hypothetical protein